MVEGVAEFFWAWPGRMPEARKIRGDKAIPGAQRGFQHRLIHAGRCWNAVEQKQDRGILWRCFSIEDIKVVDSDCVVRHRFPSKRVYSVHNHHQVNRIWDAKAPHNKESVHLLIIRCYWEVEWRNGSISNMTS